MLIANGLFLGAIDLLSASGQYDLATGLVCIVPLLLLGLLLGGLFRKEKRHKPAPQRSSRQIDPVATQITEGITYYEGGQYAQAEETLRRVLQNPLQQTAVTQMHAVAYRTLALSCACQGKVQDAFGYCRTAIDICERLKLWPSPDAVRCRQDLAWLHSLRGDFDNAETTLREILSSLETRPGRPDSAMVATVFRLAQVREKKGDLPEAERLFQESLQRYHESSWRNDKDHAGILEALSQVQFRQKKAEAAAETLQQAMAIQERSLGPDHLSLVPNLIRLWQVYVDDLSYLKAEDVCRRALAIEEKHVGPDHPATGVVLAHLVVVLERQHRCRDAAQLTARQLAILASSPECVERDTLAQRLGEYASYLRQQGRTWEADRIEYALVDCSPEYAWHVRPEQNWPLSRWN